MICLLTLAASSLWTHLSVSFTTRMSISCCLPERTQSIWTGIPKYALIELKVLLMSLNIPLSLDALGKLEVLKYKSLSFESCKFVWICIYFNLYQVINWRKNVSAHHHTLQKWPRTLSTPIEIKTIVRRREEKQSNKNWPLPGQGFGSLFPKFCQASLYQFHEVFCKI